MARWAGVLYIFGTAAGILSTVGTGIMPGATDLHTLTFANENQFILGTLFLLLMGISLALIPVVIYPVVSQVNQTLALGYVVFRGALETFTYIVTAISWLLLLVINMEHANTVTSADSTVYQSMGYILSLSSEHLHSITTIIFSLGALMLYSLLYQSRLIPRWLSGWGFIGGIIYLVAGAMALYGTNYTALQMPLALQEMVMAVWLIIKGFNQPETHPLSRK
ncbi:DUF4386 domain-containing protein [Paenibacillus tarimensis]|uniref:DUF4386 domain-containing protein n=1 Tax=Paenibacillus tarimensis TaxID=416012 RepID=UPI0039EED388